MTLNIKKDFLKPSKWARPQVRLNKVLGVVIHWVANPLSSAQGNRNYFNNRTGSYGSAHYIVGLNKSQGIIQCLPDNEMGYHVGSNTYTSRALSRLGSYPNNCTIGIEMTHIDWDGRFNDYTYNATVDLAVSLLKKYNLTENDLWLHHTVVGWKDCARWFVNNNAEWVKFKEKVGVKLRGKASLNPEVNTNDIDMVDTDANGFYTVQRGDTLWGISQAFDTTVDNLTKLNPNVQSKSLEIGQKIKIKDVVKATHKIAKGDTFWSLSSKYNITVAKLKELNPNVNPNSLKVGQEVVVSVDGSVKETPKQSTSSPSSYPTVKAGMMNNENVRKVQSLLKQRGYNIVVDGHFGANTSKMVKEFQRANGLAVDGIVGANTWRELLATPNQYGVATGDVWLHNKPDFTTSTRTRVLKKGEKVHLLDGGTSSMYKTNLGYVSKKYILLKKL